MSRHEAGDAAPGDEAARGGGAMRGGGAARPLRARMLAGESVLGTFVASRDPGSVELLGGLGFDLLCIDAEHSAMSVETVERLVAAAELTPAAPIVRVAGNEEVAIGTTLDAGAAGVLVPRVESATEAQRAIAAARYPPAGRRGLGPGRASGYGAELPSYRDRANDELLLAIQVETAEAVARLPELLAVDGIDLYFVGPGDLACSMGIEDPQDPTLKATVADVIDRARAAGRLAGVFAATPADAAAWRARGAQLVLLGSDHSLLARGVAAALGDVEGGA
ncbi:MAG: HpcH/HpaI aldolase family protein [Solirubrobacteraceae bacterium]